MFYKQTYIVKPTLVFWKAMSFSQANPYKQKNLLVFENKIYTKTILLWQVPNVLPKGSCLRPLVLKPCFLRLYAPLRASSKRKRLPVVKFWNCQSRITCEIFNFQKPINLALAGFFA